MPCFGFDEKNSVCFAWSVVAIPLSVCVWFISIFNEKFGFALFWFIMPHFSSLSLILLCNALFWFISSPFHF